jgi:hypothetical protein
MAQASIGGVWDVPLDKLRSSRLLALRMHVARYVVRAGAQQRAVVALVDEETRRDRRELLLELLEAAGSASADVVQLPQNAEAALPMADVLLFGERGRSAEEVAARVRTRGAALEGQQRWAVTLDRVLVPPGPEIVESVEALLRIVIPEALGANGTPPPSEVAVRID